MTDPSPTGPPKNSSLGISNRVRLYGVLDKSYDDPAAPAPTPVVFLCGAGAPAAVWDDIETAMHRRGRGGQGPTTGMAS